MIIELVNAKWHGHPDVVSAYIATVKLKPKRTRSRIGKEHNYKFNFKNREAWEK